MITASHPTIVMVHGAWHQLTMYNPFLDLLRAAGYHVRGSQLPSVGADPPLQNWDQDVDTIRADISKAVEAGEEVVMVVHSYGGLVGSEAVKGYTKADMEAKGLPGGVVRMIYICAFSLPVGMCLMDAIGELESWHRLEGDYIVALNPISVFYNDVPKEQAQAISDRLERHSYPTWLTKATYTAWEDVPSTYIICENDQALPASVQEGMVAGSAGKLKALRSSSGHSPYLSQPDWLARATRKIIGEDIEL